MFIEVNEIPPEGLRIDRALTIPPLLPAGGEPAPLSGVRLIGSFNRRKGDIDFRGHLEAGVSLTCSRCLSPFSFEAREDFDRIYRTGSLGRVRAEGELADDEFALTPFDGLRIDLVELAREQIYLLLPLKPLCGDECRGLCPRCGANRNLDPCTCPQERQEFGSLTLKMPL